MPAKICERYVPLSSIHESDGVLLASEFSISYTLKCVKKLKVIAVFGKQEFMLRQFQYVNIYTFIF